VIVPTMLVSWTRIRLIFTVPVGAFGLTVVPVQEVEVGGFALLNPSRQSNC
jgi:hypothetical protein